MTDPADYEMRTPPTWPRDLGSLRAVADWETQQERPNTFGNADSVAEATGLDAAKLKESLQRWERVHPPVLDALDAGIAEDISFIGLTERGRRLVGLWPSPDEFVDRLVAALDDAGDAEPDETKSSRLKTAALVIGTVARDIAVGAAGQALGGVV